MMLNGSTTGTAQARSASLHGNYPDIVLSAKYVSPVSNGSSDTEAQRRHSPTTLPLNLILLIVSYLDNIGDIARATRTCRLLYYMTLPKLYESVDLSTTARPSHDSARQATRHGIGSPFMMALNGLISSPHAGLVTNFRLRGKWPGAIEATEPNGDGRVSDSTMMLNIITRSIAARMTKLQSIAWELQDCMPLTTMYQGMASHSTLTRLTLRFPSHNSPPRVATIVPPMPNLRAFTALEIDPEGNPDDFTLFISQSLKLEDLRFHIASRLRRQGLAIIDLESMFFRICRQAQQKLRVKHFAMQNWIVNGTLTIEPGVFDEEVLQSSCILDSFAGDENEFRAVLSNGSPTSDPMQVDTSKLTTRFRKLRCNEVLPQFVHDLRANPRQIESFIMVGTKRSRRIRQRSQTSDSSSGTTTPSNASPPKWEPAALTRIYIDALTQVQGPSLRVLLLSDELGLSREQLGSVIRFCPNLEQFGFALDSSDHHMVRILAPFLAKLQCMRILDNEQAQQHMRQVGDEFRMRQMSVGIAEAGKPVIKYIGIADRVYRIGSLYESVSDEGMPEMRRAVARVDPAEVQKYEIWGSDCLDIAADPYGPFSS